MSLQLDVPMFVKSLSVRCLEARACARLRYSLSRARTIEYTHSYQLTDNRAAGTHCIQLFSLILFRPFAIYLNGIFTIRKPFRFRRVVGRQLPEVFRFDLSARIVRMRSEPSVGGGGDNSDGKDRLRIQSFSFKLFNGIVLQLKLT